jgi:hypothetical protein
MAELPRLSDGDACVGDYEDRRVRGRVVELAPTPRGLPHEGFVWYAWRSTGKTLSGTSSRSDDAAWKLEGAMGALNG